MVLFFDNHDPQALGNSQVLLVMTSKNYCLDPEQLISKLEHSQIPG